MPRTIADSTARRGGRTPVSLLLFGVKTEMQRHPRPRLDLRTLERISVKDTPGTISEIAQSIGYASTSSLWNVAPQICKKIIEKRSDQRKHASVQRRRALSLALSEEPAPSFEELRVWLNLRSIDQLRLVDGELCKSLCKRYRMRVVKEPDCVRSSIEDCLKQSNPTWKTIEHDTG